MKKRIIAFGIFLTMIISFIGAGITYHSSHESESLATKNDKMYTITNRKAITDESILAQIAALLSDDFGNKKPDYSGIEGVNNPIRIYFALEVNPKIEADKPNKNQINSTFNSATLVENVPKDAKYMAIFKIVDGVVERVYDENTKTGNGIRVLTSEDFDGDYISTSSSIIFDTDYEITASDKYTAVYFTNDAGYMGYNIGLKLDVGDTRIAFSVPNVYYYKHSFVGAPMYIDVNRPYAVGETYDIPSIEPVDTVGEYTFLAWMDKEQDQVGYDARLVESGTQIPHFYNRNDSNTQTLDALWAFFTIERERSKFYDGKTFEQEASFGYSDALDAEYLTQLAKLGVEEKEIVKKWLEDGKELSAAPKDAGSYEESFNREILLQTGGTNVITRNVSGVANIEIKKRTVTISSGSLVKVYDGKPLVDDRLDLITTGDMWNEELAVDDGNGWITDEGIDTDSIKFTGSQTEIGKSKNSFAYEGIDETNLDNYNISEEFGTLEVKPRYQIEYYYNNVKADDETKLFEMVSDDVYYEVGDVVELLDKDIVETVKRNGKEYTLNSVANQKLILTTVDKDNIIKVYYTTEEDEPPFTLDNIIKYIGILLISVIGIVAVILIKKRSNKKETL